MNAHQWPVYVTLLALPCLILTPVDRSNEAVEEQKQQTSDLIFASIQQPANHRTLYQISGSDCVQQRTM